MALRPTDPRGEATRERQSPVIADPLTTDQQDMVDWASVDTSSDEAFATSVKDPPTAREIDSLLEANDIPANNSHSKVDKIKLLIGKLAKV